MKVIQIIDITKRYLSEQLASLALDNPIISFTKPVITRIINNNIGKAKEALSLITDEYGEIDMYSLLNEMITSVMTSHPFKQYIPVLGEAEIGGGYIKFNIPMTNKILALSTDDLNKFKELFKENTV